MRVLFLTRYGALGASSRVRAYQFFPYLEANGVEVAHQMLLDDAYLNGLYGNAPVGWSYLVRRYGERVRTMLRVREYDLIWVEKEALPWLPASVERALLAGVPYVVDYDDATFHAYDQHRNALVRLGLGRRIDRIMRGAALVTVGNPYLAARAREAGARRIEVLPSVVDLERYTVRAEEEHGEGLVVGWIGSPGSEVVLGVLRDVLARLTETSPVTLRLVGAAGTYLDGIRFETRPWSEETEVDEIRRFDVGIMPLPDTPWMRGKCGYKLIQYMGCGVPVVASPVGVNREIVTDGVNGYLADTPEAWLRALAVLGEDRIAARRMGEAGRKRVEERYSLQVTAPRMLHLLREAAW